jgi:phage terminase large subunit-like protein
LKEWNTACPDWETRIVEGRSLIPLDPLFEEEADEAWRVFSGLRVADVAGSPTMGELCRPWVRDFVRSIFGAYDATSGRRLISEAMLSVSKKNIKSTLAAGIMLTALIRNWRMSAECLILAPTIEIANNSFYPARDMVRLDEELSDLMHVQDHYRQITHRQNYANLKVIAAENETVGGKKGSFIFVDELWLFGKRPNAENMLREATGGLASRPEGFVIYATTQSDETPAGVFKSKLEYARGVRDGKIEDKRFLPVLYEYPQRMLKARDYEQPANFYVTNPNLGASVDPEYLSRELKKAQSAGPESLAGFFAKHLNVEIGLRLRANRWAGADWWEQQSTAGLSLEELLRRCEVACIGIDGGGLDDFLGACVLGRERKTGNWLHWTRAWVHEKVLELRKEIAPMLRDFEADGDLRIIQHTGEDTAELAQIVRQVADSGLLERAQGTPAHSIGVDRARLGTVLDALAAVAIDTQTQVVGIAQGWQLSGAGWTAERKLSEGVFYHGGSPMMAWCVSNAKVEPKGNAYLITKAASGTAKIDPVIAMLNAVTLMSLNPQSAQKQYSLYVL